MSAAGAGFSQLRLRGGRYEQAGFPVETLAELARYERLVIDVARAVWKSDHPSRTRLPKGFTERLQLRLTEVNAGSVVPVLERALPAGETDSLFAELSDVFARARDLVTDSISALADDMPFPEGMPTEALSSFVRFGSSLREDERIEFTRNDDESRRVVYNQTVRRKLVAATSVEKYSQAGSEVGRVTALDAEAATFTVVTLRGRPLDGHYSDTALTSDFRAVLYALAEAPIVRVDGIMTVASTGQVLGIEDVRSVELFELDSEVWSTRFVELASLRRGWLDSSGAGAEVSFAALDFAREILLRVDAAGRQLPGIFPTPDGGVQLEWKALDSLVSVEVDSDLICELYAVNLTSGEERDEETSDPNIAFRFVSEVIA